jgi:hypothetical protein
MKVSINLIVKTDAYESDEQILDAVVALLEQDGFTVPWFKVREVE